MEVKNGIFWVSGPRNILHFHFWRSLKVMKDTTKIYLENFSVQNSQHWGSKIDCTVGIRKKYCLQVKLHVSNKETNTAGKSYTSQCISHTWVYILYVPTVRTVATDLRRGEHIPKMQNNIGRKNMLRVLRQPRSKYGGGGVLDAVPCCATRRLSGRWVLHNCRKFTLDRIQQRQKHHDWLEPTSFRSLISYSTNCATLTLLITYSWLNLKYTVQCTILYYTNCTILYYTLWYNTILYYTILYYTILYYTIR